MSENGYQGWTNYETWAVKLWIDNDYGAYQYWQEQTANVLDDYDEDGDNAWTELAGHLQDYHEENAPGCDGVYADLMTSALDEVNWDEIAKSMIEDGMESRIS